MANYFDTGTLEFCGGHKIGSTEEGLSIYAAGEGFEPAFRYFADEDGNWISDSSQAWNEAQISLWISAIEKALDNAVATHDQPCGAVAYFDAGEKLPWRIADDYYSQNWASPEEALAAASTWAESEL